MNNADKLKQSQTVVKAASKELSANSSISHNPKRRALLGRTLAYAGAAGAAGLGAGNALAQSLPIPESNRTMGRTIPPEDYGMPSKYEGKVKRRRTDVFVNRQNFSDWSMTPLAQQLGTVTPNGLIFERHHNGIPDINPDHHKFVIHGLVHQPLEFSMSDLMKYPSVSKFHFMECSGNGLTDWLKPSSKTTMVFPISILIITNLSFMV